LPATSNIAEVIVFNDPIISNQPITSQTLCQNATPTALTIVGTGGNGAFSYQWYSNSSNTNTGGLNREQQAIAILHQQIPSVQNIIIGVVSQNSTLVVVLPVQQLLLLCSAPTITQPFKLCLPRRHSNYFVYHSNWCY
jgi:hypothetical protein